ncbi:N-acetyltransferase [Actinocrispum sp. NPDC049592]|uniref:GNAT family N-acetyltransferase n=1 Tax=Actinocrispum sp. NPDC049592 TaxID=3154835 RepID=UPI00342132C4
MLVRRERSGDRYGIWGVHRAAFGRDVEASLVDELRDSSAWLPALSFVAFLGDDMAGHVVCSRATIDGRQTLGLGPLGVLPRLQGRGIGAALMHTVIGAADALGEPLIVLLGDPKYYARFGFVPAAKMDIMPQDAKWAKHFQARALSMYDSGFTGEFRYAEAFARASQ